jgi:hypothetical protein
MRRGHSDALLLELVVDLEHLGAHVRLDIVPRCRVGVRPLDWRLSSAHGWVRKRETADVLVGPVARR